MWNRVGQGGFSDAEAPCPYLSQIWQNPFFIPNKSLISLKNKAYFLCYKTKNPLIVWAYAKVFIFAIGIGIIGEVE